MAEIYFAEGTVITYDDKDVRIYVHAEYRDKIRKLAGKQVKLLIIYQP